MSDSLWGDTVGLDSAILEHYMFAIPEIVSRHGSVNRSGRSAVESGTRNLRMVNEPSPGDIHTLEVQYGQTP